MIITIVVCMIAGLGAGIGTGLAGLSAAAVITPMLITFLDMDAFDAVGVALSSDVLASAISAYTYGKNKNIDIKNGLVLLAAVLVFTIVGTYTASLVPNAALGGFSVFMTLFIGIKFIVKPTKPNPTKEKNQTRQEMLFKSLFFGAIVGFICGFIGAGGGMMLLLILTSILNYDLKKAVGTSVFIMSFTAFTGAVSHFAVDGEIPDVTILSLCIFFTLVGAQIASRFANKATPETLNRITGYVLSGLGIFMIIMKYF
ncbi:MAG: sulfite exporter TauE/SafE family protein [Breznakia sp.]